MKFLNNIKLKKLKKQGLIVGESFKMERKRRNLF